MASCLLGLQLWPNACDSAHAFKGGTKVEREECTEKGTNEQMRRAFINTKVVPVPVLIGKWSISDLGTHSFEVQTPHQSGAGNRARVGCRVAQTFSTP